MPGRTDVPDYYQQSRHIYAFRHALNTVDVYLPTKATEKAKLWIIYIHGGAWRSPLIDSTSIVPALHYLNPEELDIAGVASINYGLSPYPDHATLPSSPSDPSRNNKHPKHLEDVMAALDWLQSKYAYGSNYVLAGHSCGATLAFQILTRPIGKSTALCKASMAPTLPSAVVGLHGIYDVAQLVKDFEDVPMYRSIVEGAFGKRECGMWKIVSPAGWPYERLWSRGGVTVLAHSDEDELVNWKQTELMVESLSQGGEVKRRDVRLKTTGKHDEIWGQGKELARVLTEALKITKESLE